MRNEQLGHRYHVFAPFYWHNLQFSSVAESCLNLCNPMDCSTPGFPVLHHLPKLVQTHVHQVGESVRSNHLILCHPLLLALQSFQESRPFPMSQFSTSGGQSKGVSASTSVLPMNIRDISFRTDWFALLVVQGTLKSLFQHHSSKASILWHSAVFTVQLSHPYKRPWHKPQFQVS